MRSNYDTKAHTRGGSRQAGILTDDFVDRFAIVDPLDRCIERLHSLARLGLDKGAVSGALAEHISLSKELVARQELLRMVHDQLSRPTDDVDCCS